MYKSLPFVCMRIYVCLCQGPSFVPGQPLPLFNESRRAMYERSFPAPLILQEMLLWLEESEYTKAHCGSATFPPSSPYASFGHITQHTYSRGYVTERVLYDCWLGLTQWLGDALGTPSSTKPVDTKVHISHTHVTYIHIYLYNCYRFDVIYRSQRCSLPRLF